MMGQRGTLDNLFLRGATASNSGGPDRLVVANGELGDENGFLDAFFGGDYLETRRPLASWLSAFLEFEPADMAAADHTLIMDDVAPSDLGHHGEIEVADFRITLRQTVKDAIGRLYRGKFFFR
jgi:hypothetical protein